MYATITILTFQDAASESSAMSDLRRLIDRAGQLPEVEYVYVVHTADVQVTMLTAYSDEHAADTASELIGPELRQALGTRVAGPPQRLAGPIMIASPESRAAGSGPGPGTLPSE
ncbi:MAG: hypothetical protein L0H59_13725 [Tomitella sp.]|nr:hypothetical protein [Tomitella sp.]